MKLFLVFLAVLVMVAGLYFLAPAQEKVIHSWGEGDINPDDIISKWALVKPPVLVKFGDKTVLLKAVVENPNPAGKIKIKHLMVFFQHQIIILLKGEELFIEANSTLLSYRYFKDGNPYEFRRNGEGSFFKYTHNFMEIKKCTGCHPGKINNKFKKSPEKKKTRPIFNLPKTVT